MIAAGVDIGNKAIKVVILKDREIESKFITFGSYDRREAGKEAVARAANQGGISWDQIDRITITGAGAKRVDFATDQITVVGAVAKGAASLFPAAGIVMDVGAEEGRIAKYNPNGQVVDFVTNEKCAAGAGTFIETVARALEIQKVAEMGPLSLISDNTIPINGQCVVFAESEVVSLIHGGAAREDIARAVYDSVAGRMSAMAMRVGIGSDVVVSGGVANDVGFINALKRALKVNILIPDDPVYVGALGAALAAANG